MLRTPLSGKSLPACLALIQERQLQFCSFLPRPHGVEPGVQTHCFHSLCHRLLLTLLGSRCAAPLLLTLAVSPAVTAGVPPGAPASVPLLSAVCAGFSQLHPPS